MADQVAKLSRALISVSDKTGLVDFARAPRRSAVSRFSRRGGTAKALAAAGVPVREVSDFTGAPEILDGRVKTLHPRVHGGILGRPTDDAPGGDAAGGHRPDRSGGREPLPVRETVARGAPFDEVIENIDIGGPSMIRSAAKNHARVAVVVDPADYAGVLAELETRGEVSDATRFRLARKAFAHTARYDGAIASYLGRHRRRRTRRRPTSRRRCTCRGDARAGAPLRREPAPEGGVLRARRRARGPSLARAEVLQGKELSYNNLLDLDAALRLCASSPRRRRRSSSTPTPAARPSPRGWREAYRRAREADPVTAFGGIVAVNRAGRRRAARELTETFLECVIAPAFAPEALAVAGREEEPAPAGLPIVARRRAGALELRSVAGGFLVQTRTATPRRRPPAKVVTEAAAHGGGAGAISTSPGGSAST